MKPDTLTAKYRLCSDRTSPFRQFGKWPFLWVRLAHGDSHIELDCLIDSGAGDSLFNVDVADAIGIDLSGAPEKEYLGINGEPLIGRIHPVQLQVKGLSEWIEIHAGFIEVDQIPILGQSGFFDNYEITFRRYNKRFEITSRTSVHTRQRNKQFTR
jgi:hypothetical protein